MLPDDYVEPMQNSEPSVAKYPNLKPFQPGQSGNPSGRPPGIPDRRRISKEVAEVLVDAEWVDGKTVRMGAEYAMVAALWRKAIAGDVAAIKEIQDTLHGKIPDKQELTGANGEPLTAIVRTVVDPKIDKA